MRLLSFLVELLVWVVSIHGEAVLAEVSTVATNASSAEQLGTLEETSAVDGTTSGCHGDGCAAQDDLPSTSHQIAVDKVQAALEAAVLSGVNGGHGLVKGTPHHNAATTELYYPARPKGKWGKDSGMSWEVESDVDLERSRYARTQRFSAEVVDSERSSWERTSQFTYSQDKRESDLLWSESRERYYQVLYAEYASSVDKSPGGKKRFKEHQEKIDRWKNTRSSGSRHSGYSKKSELLGEAADEVRRLQAKYLEKLVELEGEYEQDVAAGNTSPSYIYSNEEAEQMLQAYYQRQKENFAREALEQRRERYNSVKRSGRGMTAKSTSTREMSAGEEELDHGTRRSSSPASSTWRQRSDKERRSSSTWRQRSDKERRSWRYSQQQQAWQSPGQLKQPEPFPSSSTLPSPDVNHGLDLPSASTLRKHYEAVKAAITMQPTQYFHASSAVSSSSQRLRRKSRLFSF